MIKLQDILKEISYPFSEYDTTYDDEDNSLIDVEYTFKTEENTYKVVLSSKEKAREFEVSFGIDTGNFNKIDTFQMTGEGNARNILQTLADIINDFYYNNEFIYMSAYIFVKINKSFIIKQIEKVNSNENNCIVMTS